MSHYILKLVTGEFVYGKIDIDNTDKKMVSLTNPLVWEEYTSEDGQSGTAMVKYVTGTHEDTIPIATSSIISMATMSEPFTAFYEAAVGITKISDQNYDAKLADMTARMKLMINDHHARKTAKETDELVSYSTDTIH